MWKYTGTERPPFAMAPGPSQESVWDYPRPPKIAPDKRRVIVRFNHITIAESVHTVRVLETASPPTFYIPQSDVNVELLQVAHGASLCEWKGRAAYWRLKAAGLSQSAVGWSYPTAKAPYESISGYYSFYPGRMDCFVDGESVRPQPGSFYSGWVTDEVVGPWKGDPGTETW